MEMTSLSAGIVLHAILNNDEVVSGIVTKIIPVAVDKAELPYIVYARQSMSHEPTKAGAGADTIVISIDCYAVSYKESIELAEAVRNALSYATRKAEGLRLRSCTLTGAKETFTADAYVQELNFTLRI